MFVFTILRVHYKFAEEKIRLDNTFAFYFSLTLERLIREKYCIQKGISCLKCKYNKACPIPQLFWSEIIFKEPPMLITRLLNQDEELYKDKNEIIFELTLLGDIINRIEIIKEALESISEIPPYSFVSLSGIYIYDYFSSTETEKIEDVETVPKYSGNMLFDLKTGKNKLKLKIFPSFIDSKLADSLIKNIHVKDTLLKLLKRKVKRTLDFVGCSQDFCFDSLLTDFEVSKIYSKEIYIGDLNIKKLTSYFPNYKFFEGKFALKGNLGDIYPLLALAEILNIGKLASFGFGRLKIIETMESRFPLPNEFRFKV
jgi:hypothetical protein